MITYYAIAATGNTRGTGNGFVLFDKVQGFMTRNKLGRDQLLKLMQEDFSDVLYTPVEFEVQL